MSGTAPDPSGSGRPSATLGQSPSLGDLLSEVSRDISTLMRQEVELAKAELKQSATQAGRGAGMFTGAAVAAQMVVVFLSIALWWAVGQAISNFAWSAILVAVIWAVVGAVLAARGKRELAAMRGMPQTTQTVKKIPDALNPQKEEDR